MRSLAGSNVLVTGANRGLGAAFVEEALLMGASKIYAGERNRSSISPRSNINGVIVPIQLDLCEEQQIDAAASQCCDVDLVISNAGITTVGGVLDMEIERCRAMMEVNFFGPLLLTKAFAPILSERRGGIIYVLSVAALLPGGPVPIYAATKAASAHLGAALQSELRDANITVALSYPGFIDTGMGSSVSLPKTSPSEVARRSLNGWLRGDRHIFPDRHSEITRKYMIIDGERALLSPDELREDIIRELCAPSEREAGLRT